MKFHFAQDKFWNPMLEGYPLIRIDKWVHMLGCAFLFSLVYFGAYRLPGLQEMAMYFTQKHVAAFWALLAGFLWEVKDGFREEGFSWRDLVADMIGVFALWGIAV